MLSFSNTCQSFVTGSSQPTFRRQLETNLHMKVSKILIAVAARISSSCKLEMRLHELCPWNVIVQERHSSYLTSPELPACLRWLSDSSKTTRMECLSSPAWIFLCHRDLPCNVWKLLGAWVLCCTISRYYKSVHSRSLTCGFQTQLAVHVLVLILFLLPNETKVWVDQCHDVSSHEEVVHVLKARSVFPLHSCWEIQE